MKQPWTPLGIDWLLVLIVFFIVLLGLLHAITVGELLILVCIGLLALALLL